METLGRYELRDTLGAGGFATVYRASDPALGREVALKALHPHLASLPEVRERFLAEARALARLRHPNIVTIYDVSESDGRPFFTMELIEGRTLAELVEDGHGRPAGQVAAIVTGLASALDYLHGAGLIHRDIKAANVMLDGFGRAVLMDFGIARVLDQTQFTRTGLMLGTPEYMAPEQVRGHPAGPPADIYALGVLTYQLLAGQPPFVGDTGFVLHGHAYEPPPPLRSLRPGLPEPVYAALDAALAKQPSERPTHAARLADALAGGPESTAAQQAPSPPSSPTPARAAAPSLSTQGYAANGPRIVAQPVNHAAPRPSPMSPRTPRATASPTRPRRRTKPWLLGSIGFALLVTTLIIVAAASRPSGTTTAAVGSTLFQDDFNNPSSGKLAASCSAPSQLQSCYAGGEYVIKNPLPPLGGLNVVELPSRYQDAAIDVNARVVSSSAQPYVAIACKDSPDGHYRLIIDDTGQFKLSRFDGDIETSLVDWQSSQAIRQHGDWNDIELSCSGSIIRATINRTQVASVSDSRYQSGAMWIGVGPTATTSQPAEAHFDNLSIVQR